MSSYVSYRITPEGIPSQGRMFVNHQKNHRSGHLSHALVEYKKGHIIAFYSNCSGMRNRWSPGHNGFGWLEYKTSADGGETWSVRLHGERTPHAFCVVHQHGRHSLG